MSSLDFSLQAVEHNTMDRGKMWETKDCMLDYLIALLDDTNDFSWQSAMASHAVLLCQMEQGKISSWSETEKIESGMQMPRDIYHWFPIFCSIAKK